MLKKAKPGKRLTFPKLIQLPKNINSAVTVAPLCFQRMLHGFLLQSVLLLTKKSFGGIPSAKRKLKNGDVLSIDLVSSIDGYHGDSAVTIPIGHVKPDVMKLLKVTEESLFVGIGTRESR